MRHNQQAPQQSASAFQPSEGPLNLYTRQADRVLPKNFTKPFTCFYWYTWGNCRKSDDDCGYAHYDTGNIASAPAILDRERAIENLQEREQAIAEKERALQEHTERIKAREKRPGSLEHGFRKLEAKRKQLHEDVYRFYDGVRRARTTINKSDELLQEYRDEARAIRSLRSGMYTQDILSRLGARLFEAADNTVSEAALLGADLYLVKNRFGDILDLLKRPYSRSGDRRRHGIAGADEGLHCS